MLNLAEGLLSFLLVAGAQDASRIGDPAPPTAMASLTEGLTALGYDTFDADGDLVFRVTFTPLTSEAYERPPSELVWEARRVRFLPEADRAVEQTTSLECPGFFHILERMAALEVGSFNVLGVTQVPLTMGPQTRDSYTYRFHGPGNDPVNARTRLSVEGSAGVVGDLGQAADFQFKDCWRTDSRG